jgi:hypothetical protein
MPDDVPVGPAASGHYARQFGSRIEKISKGGPPPQSPSSNGGCGRIGAGAGLGVVLLIIRLAVGIGGSGRTSNYNTYTPPTYTPPVQQLQPGQGGFDKDRQAKDANGEAMRRILGQPAKDRNPALDKDKFGGGRLNDDAFRRQIGLPPIGPNARDAAPGEDRN